ncbi:MAG: hypothetical protein AABX28_03075, partial [Nanoarchaeota archaeon]
EFKRLKEAGIPCFLISGSHDYSVSGKTFLDVLEKAGFCRNVSVFSDEGEKIILEPTIHKGVALYGYPGKKSGLDVGDLKRIKLAESKEKFRILMLHTTIDKAVGNLPMEYIEADSLPESDYCALGHIHIKLHYKNFVYPGPVFPNNFAELEELEYGGFCIVDTENKNYLKRVELKIIDVEKITIEINDAVSATEKIISEMEKRDLKNKIVLLRIKGELKDSKNSDIKFQQIEDFAKQKEVYCLLKNIHELKTAEVELESEIEQSENIEGDIIKIYTEQNPSKFNSFIFEMINSLSTEKQEGETSETFLNRLISESKKILNF